MVMVSCDRWRHPGDSFIWAQRVDTPAASRFVTSARRRLASGRPVRYAVVASRGVWRSLVACFVRDEEGRGFESRHPDSCFADRGSDPVSGWGLLSFRRNTRCSRFSETSAPSPGAIAAHSGRSPQRGASCGNPERGHSRKRSARDPLIPANSALDTSLSGQGKYIFAAVAKLRFSTIRSDVATKLSRMSVGIHGLRVGHDLL